MGGCLQEQITDYGKENIKCIRFKRQYTKLKSMISNYYNNQITAK